WFHFIAVAACVRGRQSRAIPVTRRCGQVDGHGRRGPSCRFQLTVRAHALPSASRLRRNTSLTLASQRRYHRHLCSLRFSPEEAEMKMRTWMAAAMLVAALPTIGRAQTDQGKFTGTVHDSSGAFVAGATVTIKNERTGEERTQMTSA